MPKGRELQDCGASVGEHLAETMANLKASKVRRLSHKRMEMLQVPRESYRWMEIYLVRLD